MVEIAARVATLPSGGTGVVAKSGAFKAMMLDLSEEIGRALPALSNADSSALRAALVESCR